ncbi:hypothetical protein FACS18949_12990 [Clostridia bacterium]|nr:hypothetical protein FACS189425_04330 [Clostridia bacterium]GHV35303.1 hypothetical protein FACS18949_12990 [Clostridia bacterium]
MADNISLNAVYTLKCPGDADSVATLSASGAFSLNGANAYTLSIGFYYTGSENGILFKQDTLFMLSISGKLLTLNIPGIASAQMNADGFFIENSFNNVDITYNRTTLNVYMNGILVFTKEITATGAVSALQYTIGAGYLGYISRVRLADYALTQAEIGANTARNVIATPRLEAYIDFTSSSPKDVGKHKLILVCRHLCCSANIAEVFDFGDNGAVAPLSSPPLAVSFTVLAKIYMPPITVTDSTLVYHAGTSDFALGIKNGRLTCVCRGQTLTAQSELPTQCWLDAAVTLSGNTLTLYADGVQSATMTLTGTSAALTGSLFIGNTVTSGQLRGKSFTGYIDTVAIFDTPLTAATLLSYVPQPPFIFDAHITALYICAHDRNKSDLISSSTLSFLGTARAHIAENTTMSSAIPAFSYRTNAAAIIMLFAKPPRLTIPCAFLTRFTVFNQQDRLSCPTTWRIRTKKHFLSAMRTPRCIAKACASLGR